MKKAIIVIAIVSGFLFSAYGSQAQQSAKADIEKLIFSYQGALNGSDA